jgi:uncharacterized LabA/DUF88 family protein
MRAAIFVDLTNLFQYVSRRYSGQRINYQHYYKWVKETYGEVLGAFAYASEISEELRPFYKALEHIGFQVKYKPPQKWMRWTCGIAMDIARIVDNVDVIVIGSSDANLADAVEFVKERGKKCVVLACCISKGMKDAASKYIEINGEFLEATAVPK